MTNEVNNTQQFISKQTMNRLIKDIVSLHRQPLTEQGIYYQHDDTNMLNGYAMIIGPKDTPYEHGFFFFHFRFPDNYPVEPPKVTYMTNDGATRFHPNLYRNGKTCLSILNTWRGEGWTSCQTIRSVLLTLVSILDENPLLNEPGIREDNLDVPEYKSYVRYKTLEYAHLKMIDQFNMPAQFIVFHPFILQYCNEHKDEILETYKSCAKTYKKHNIRVHIYGMNTGVDYKKLYQSAKNTYETLG